VDLQPLHEFQRFYKSNKRNSMISWFYVAVYSIQCERPQTSAGMHQKLRKKFLARPVELNLQLGKPDV
jgi:hypothetical protein